MAFTNIYSILLFVQFALCYQDKSHSLNDIGSTTKIEDDWSLWSEWSACSRTCGKGVAVQSRRCLDFQGCKGNSVRYRICNGQPCAVGSRDFRSVQCSEFDSIPYNGGFHEWEPATGDAWSECALTCSARGMNGPPVNLRSRVIDGTPCANDSHRICVHGDCQSIGCDEVVGSEKTDDDCGVCGGDGSSCRRRPITRWDQTGHGPCSATCGGGYRSALIICIETETGLELSDEFCSADSIKPFQDVSACALQPCLAAWDVMPWESCSVSCGSGYQLREVSCVEFRNGTKIRVADHDCSVPRPLHRRPCGDTECPMWFGGIWSQCSVSCGEGIQRRAVQCRDLNGKSSDACAISIRLPSTRPCRTGIKCPPSTLSSHSKHPTLSAWSKTPREQPYLLQNSEPQQYNEATVPSEPTFISGKWSICSASCGEGIQTRNVTCKIYLEFSQTVAVLPDSQCPGNRPVEAKRCYLRPCPPIMLSESAQEKNEFSKHFTSLESLDPPSSSLLFHMDENTDARVQVVKYGLQSLEESVPNDIDFSLTYSEGLPLIVSLGSQKKKKHNPHDKDEAYEIFQPAVFKYKWKSFGYTACSASCFGGIQESVYRCIKSEDEEVVSAHHCSVKSRPDTFTKTCNDFPCPPHWEVSQYGQCSSTCGGGITKREVKCIHQVTATATRKLTLPYSLCPHPPPSTEKFCNTVFCPPVWLTGKWSQCNSSCGRGVKTRSVECVTLSGFGNETTVELPHSCPKERPRSIRKCKNYVCGKRHRVKSPNRKFKGPLIKTQNNQNYKQKRFMKTVILKIGGKASVFHGSNVKIKCPVRRFDRRNLTWWRDGTQVGSPQVYFRRIRVTKKGILKIHRVQYADAALYICKAERQRASLNMRVEPLPSSFAPSDDDDDKWSHSSTRKLLPGDPESYEGTNSIYGTGSSNHTHNSINKFHYKHKNPLISDYSKLSKNSEKDLETEKYELIKVKDSLKSSTEPSSYVYGKVSHHGFPARSAATKGISLLSDKVSKSKKNNQFTRIGLLRPLSLHQTSIQTNKDLENAKNIDDLHIYGRVVQKSNESDQQSKKIHFGTLRDTLEEANLVPNSEIKDESIIYRLPSDAPLGVPQILGKGSRDSLGFEWKLTNWTLCFQTCSFSGSSGSYQFRTAQCVVRVDNMSQAVDGVLCEDAGLAAPPTIQRCGFTECPQWRASAWSDCEKSRCYTLHYAYQRRIVSCILHNGTLVSSSHCDDVTKPIHKRECYNRQCHGVWRTGEWSQCTAPCNGQGYRTRLLHCVWNGTKKSAGNACRNLPRPEVVKWCEGEPCPEKGKEDDKEDSDCKDMSRYCKIVARINMCRVQHYKQKCCQSCQ